MDRFPAAKMVVSDIGLAAIKSREGVRLVAYRDSVGVPTIGWGHTAGVVMGASISMAQAEIYLRQDIGVHAAPILAAISVPISQNECDALVSIAFNIGVGGFRASTFLRLLNAGDRAGCAASIMNWTKPPEITSRRQAERDQFLTPYEVALPRARSTDRTTVYVPTIPVVTQPIPPVPPAAPVAPSPARGFWATVLLRLQTKYPPKA